MKPDYQRNHPRSQESFVTPLWPRTPDVTDHDVYRVQWNQGEP